MKNIRISICLSAWAAAVLGLSGCEREKPVSFSADIQPILQLRCASCHQPGGEGYQKSSFGVATYADLMEGTAYGPMIVPGDSFNSNLVVLLEGRADPSIAMPHGGEPLPQQEIETIKRWIDQGASDN